VYVTGHLVGYQMLVATLEITCCRVIKEKQIAVVDCAVGPAALTTCLAAAWSVVALHLDK
jgi:hypothetical protein